MIATSLRRSNGRNGADRHAGAHALQPLDDDALSDRQSVSNLKILPKLHSQFNGTNDDRVLVIEYQNEMTGLVLLQSGNRDRWDHGGLCCVKIDIDHTAGQENMIGIGKARTDIDCAGLLVDLVIDRIQNATLSIDFTVSETQLRREILSQKV